MYALLSFCAIAVVTFLHINLATWMFPLEVGDLSPQSVQDLFVVHTPQRNALTIPILVGRVTVPLCVTLCRQSTKRGGTQQGRCTDFSSAEQLFVDEYTQQTDRSEEVLILIYSLPQ